MGMWFSHRRFRRDRPFMAAATAALLAGPALAWGQDFVVRTVASPPPAISVNSDSGKSDARVIELTPTRELLILLSPDALTPEDLAPVQTFCCRVVSGIALENPGSDRRYQRRQRRRGRPDPICSGNSHGIARRAF